MEKSNRVFIMILVLHVLKSVLASSLSLANECSLLFQFKENMSINKSASDYSHAYSKVISWNLNTSHGSRSCCLWEGVECMFGHVIGLDLSNSLLDGHISSNNTLFNLIHLRTLNLAYNDFQYSQIPSGIGRLSQLENLNLSNSAFSGEVPEEISQLRNLVSLDLSNNDGLKLQNSDFQNIVQNSSETLRELFLSDVNIDSEIPDSLVNSSLLTSLVMSDCGLRGEFPTGIFNLPKLQHLDVRVNNLLTGYIPEFHGNTKLKKLILGHTKFQGSIPASIGNLSQLNILDISSCAFAGTLPACVSNLTHLEFMDLSGNKFTGSLPCLESFSNLTYLSLSKNSFDKWGLPDWFGKLKKITYLYLEDVNLYGEIPTSFFNLTQVEKLYLSRNQLNDNVTMDFYRFLSLKKLKYLGLSGYNLTLSVIDNHTNENQPMFVELKLPSCNLKAFPEFLRFQHQLQYLNLDNNNIEGLIPGWLWNIITETLIDLSLARNLLVGFQQHSPVAPWVGLLSLDLSHNMLTGEIPPSICDLLSLLFLDLSFNRITGSIPSCMEKLSNSYLLMLDLRCNTLQGIIPNIFTNQSRLELIDLSENKLEGPLPRSLENCVLLHILDLGYNFIDDTFPIWLGALSELQVLILRFNRFHGAIRTPSKIKVNFPRLHVIDLSFNSFSGDLPNQYFHGLSAMKGTEGNARYMQLNDMGVIYMRDGYCWFSIEMTNKGENMVYKKILNTFFAIDLSSNMFTGKIPESIKTLSGLKLLNLSNNELSGDPPSIGNLIRLESLDLSSNKLSGMIPQNLVQLNFLEVLDVSNNRLTRPIPQGKQFNTFSSNSYMGNQALCGYPLSMKCGDSKSSKAPKVSFEEDTKSDFPNGIDWFVILIGSISGLVIGLIFGDHLTSRNYKWFLQRF